MHGVFLDLDTVSRDDLSLESLRRELSDLTVYGDSDADQIRARVGDAQVLLINKIKVDRDLLAAAPQLRLIVLAATGYDNVDLEAAAEAGVTVCNIRDYCTASVAQHVWALILSLSQHLREYDQAVRQGAWTASAQFCLLDWPIQELAGKRLGIVGYGTLGRAVARIGESFGMDVVLAQRPGSSDRVEGRLPWDEFLASVDVLSLHCPLNSQTHHLIDATALAKMKASALLINTSRGAVVDTAALAEALERNRIAGAGIDVLAQEPPVDGDPLLSIESPRLILSPHIAWAAREARQRALDEMAANIQAFTQGRARNALRPD